MIGFFARRIGLGKWKILHIAFHGAESPITFIGGWLMGLGNVEYGLAALGILWFVRVSSNLIYWYAMTKEGITTQKRSRRGHKTNKPQFVNMDL